MMKQVLVTGASGFIASHLIPALKQTGVEVVEFSRKNGQQINKADDFSSLPKADVVFHLGAVSGYQDSNKFTLKAYEVNVLGTINVLKYCKRVGAKMVFPSTYVYDQPYTELKKETDKTKPTTYYAFTKLLGERCCQFYSRVFGVNTLILRTSNVYGVGQDNKYIVPIIVNHLVKGLALTLTKPGVERTYIHISDLIKAYISLAKADTEPGDVYHVAYSKATSLADLVKLVEKVSGKKLKLTFSGQSRPHDIDVNRLDICKIEEKIGWQPKIDLETGLKMYLLNLVKKSH